MSAMNVHGSGWRLEERSAEISGRLESLDGPAAQLVRPAEDTFGGLQWHVPDTMTARWAMDGELVIVGAGALAATAEDVKKGFGLRSKAWLIGSGSERRARARLSSGGCALASAIALRSERRRW